MNAVSFVAVTLVVAGGLAVPLRAAEFSPVGEVLQAMRNTPYECTDYDRASDSCSSVSLMTEEESSLLNTSWFALPNPGGSPWVFEIYTDYEIVMGWGCIGNSQGVAVAYSSGGQPELGETYAQQIRAQLVEAMDPDEPCAGYHPTGPQQYRVEFRHYDGTRAMRKPVTVDFFATPKSVRP